MWFVYLPQILILSAAVGGLSLLGLGLAGRREDQAPHCRYCGYNLTGLISPRCPECGRLITRAGIVTTRRQVNRWFVTAGLLLLLIPSATLATAGRQAILSLDGYPFKPTRWVVADAGADDSVLALRAYRELLRRFWLRRLSDKQTRQLAEIALDRNVQSRRAPTPNDWSTDILYRLLLGGHLTHSQQKRFFDNLLTVQLSPRLDASPADDPVIDLRVHYREFPAGLEARISSVRLHSTDVEHLLGPTPHAAPRPSTFAYEPVSITGGGPGTVTRTLRSPTLHSDLRKGLALVTIEFFDTSPSNVSRPQNLHQVKQAFSLKAEPPCVLPARAGNPPADPPRG